MLLRYENQIKTTKLQNVVIKPRKIIVEWILSAWNDISCEAIRKSFKSCTLTTALDGDGDENGQIQLQAEILIDEDKRETKKLMYYYDVLFEIFLLEKCC